MSRLLRQYHCLNTSHSIFYWTTTCSPPRSGGEHGSISHQISSVDSCTAITRMSTAHVQLPENSKTVLSGTTAVSINRHQEIQLIGFSPILSTLSMMSSPNLSSRPLSGACST